MRITYFLFIGIFIGLVGCSTKKQNQAPTSTPKSYVCYQSQGAVQIDGIGNESSWLQARWTNDFIDIEGCDKPVPRYRTRAKLLWDKDYLYVLAQLYEPHVWGTLHQRDTVIFLDNAFEVFIDPDGDSHNYYEYEINALGTEWDLKLNKPYRDGGRANSRWNFNGIKSAVSIKGSLNDASDTDSCWTVEIAFPLKDFSDNSVVIPPVDGDQWRINLMRVQWKTSIKGGKYVKERNIETNKAIKEDYWVWTSQDEISMHKPERWGYLQFSSNVVGGHTVDFEYNPDENLKFYLRAFYYEQNNFHRANKRYIKSLKETQTWLDKEKLAYYKPRLILTETGYSIEAYSPDSHSKWSIDQSGRVWKSSKE